ncbi:MAG: phytase [Phycisphaerales bacterium]|nr:phytase [Phycisphaerales bacterium]
MRSTGVRLGILAVLAAAGQASAQLTGPSTSDSAYVVPVVGGTSTTSVLTAADAVPGGYRMAGVPDGLGAFDNGDGTFTLLCNHEFSRGQGAVRAHGATGSFVAAWTIDSSTLEVLSGHDLMQRIFVWNKGTAAYEQSGAEAFERFCSADLAAVTAYYNAASGKGTTNRIFMNGEETTPPYTPDHGRAMAHIATGPDTGSSYEIPWLGRMAFENVLASPYAQDKTIVFGSDDANGDVNSDTPCEIYMYVGEKRDTGSDIERAGLVGGDLFGMKVSVDGGLVTGESNDFGFGTDSYVAHADCEFFGFGDVSGMDGIELQSESIANDVFRLQRIEDGCWDTRPGHENTYYFVTTASTTKNSRLWRITFHDIADPAAGGVVDILLRGDEGQLMFDNICMDRAGNIILLEDIGGDARLGKIWQYGTASGELTQIATHDPDRFENGGSNFLTTNEEASGIIDAGDILGPGWLLLVDQAHYTIDDPEIAEGGQLLAMFNFDTFWKRPGDFNQDGAVDTRDVSAFLNGWADRFIGTDYNRDGSHDSRDVVAFLNSWVDNRD